MGCRSLMPSLEPLHSTSLWTSRAIPPRKQQASCRTLRPPSPTVRRLSAQDVPTCYYSSSPPNSYNLVISKLRTSGFTPVLVSLQQGAQRTTCLGFSCTPALFAASPSHSDFCRLPGKPSTGMLNQFHVFQTRGSDLKFYEVQNPFCICFQYYLFGENRLSRCSFCLHGGWVLR